MKILVTGTKGQLGVEVVELFYKKGYEVYGLEELDITNQDQVNEVVLKIKPNIIIHTAAYT